ncbi:hypothetical protein HHI36_002154, partial [Cryptolaemus montrouzieri]
MGVVRKQEELEIVTVYKYLRTVISNYGKIDLEIARRQEIVNIYYAIDKKILSKLEIDKTTKSQVYNTIALSSILYVSKVWVRLKMPEQKLNAIKTKFFRRITEKTKCNKIKNSNKPVKQKPIMRYFQYGQLNWFGHIKRMDS